MKAPELPAQESSRLEALRSLDILDTSSEERFDRLTRLAQRLFDVPIALVSLIDQNRQWFKSCIGLEVRETPRAISFCGHAILKDEIFVVPDASKNPVFSDNPLVTEAPFIRFYAGCPLRFVDGSLLGTLCIIDTEPREFSPEDLQSLRDLAELTERELIAAKLATLDDLTGLTNRRGFIPVAQNNLDLCLRKGLPVSIAFLDLDKFKQINDEFGHFEGDLALQAFADQMRATFRDSDVYARIGGDEFIVLLPDTTKQVAHQSITRLHKALDAYNQQSQRGYEIAFTEGLVTVEKDDGRSITALINHADAAMYKNK